MDETEFKKIDITELLPKFSLLARDQKKVSVWRKDETPDSFRVKDFSQEDGKYKLILFYDQEKDFHSSLRVYLSFKINNVDYFSEGVLNKTNGMDEVEVYLLNNIYRSEKRGKERLLTFPHHQVYSYFEFENYSAFKSELTKVVELKEFQTKNKFREIRKEQLTDPVKNFIKTQLDVNEDLIGFRVIDLSENGISFMINGKEKILFDDQSENLDLTILSYKETFKLSGGKLVYMVDFLGGSSEEKSMFKVGLTFDKNEKLTSLVNRLIEQSNVKNSTQQEFEDFIDK